MLLLIMKLEVTKCDNTVCGRVSTTYASFPKIKPHIQHFLLWKAFPSSADTRIKKSKLSVPGERMGTKY